MTRSGRIARIALIVLVAGVVTALIAACSARAPDPQRHPLPRLPELGTVELPGGFRAYDEATAPFASRHPIHVDSALFELDPSDDLGGNHHCRAQITVSPHDPQVVTPTAYTDLLGTKLCDADWFVTQFDQSWRPHDTGDPQLWTLEFVYSDVGWFSVRDLPAVAVILFVPERGFTVGLWALEEIYSRDAAVALVRQVAQSIG
jgi:hypothetical protein